MALIQKIRTGVNINEKLHLLWVPGLHGDHLILASSRQQLHFKAISIFFDICEAGVAGYYTTVMRKTPGDAGKILPVLKKYIEFLCTYLRPIYNKN